MAINFFDVMAKQFLSERFDGNNFYFLFFKGMEHIFWPYCRHIIVLFPVESL